MMKRESFNVFVVMVLGDKYTAHIFWQEDLRKALKLNKT